MKIFFYIYLVYKYKLIFKYVFILERILVLVLPNLEERLNSENVELRRGVAIALNEIISNTHRDIVETHGGALSPSIKKCLSDSDKSVRDAAALAFGSFHQVFDFYLVDK